ncbi:MAG TPA: CAP domain-containing protein [Solirubrobacterales bacterium]|nr:CAP domain-containing protein [Solirubrobacterales bacterium]
MVRKFSLLFTFASLAALAIAAPASATGGALIAPASVCPMQGTLDAPAATQESAMLCMTDFARAHAGLAELSTAEELEQSAGDKGDDILRCDSFSHFACGREFTYWMRQTGYISSQCWRAGENLAWGTDGYGTVRSIFRAWMNSPGHRENILGDFNQIGISVRIGALAGQPDTHIWAQHFGSHC